MATLCSPRAATAWRSSAHGGRHEAHRSALRPGPDNGPGSTPHRGGQGGGAHERRRQGAPRGALPGGPDPITDQARLEIEVVGGETITIVLDIAHAKALSARLDEIVSGRVMARPPSRRGLEIALFDENEIAETEPPRAAG